MVETKARKRPFNIRISAEHKAFLQDLNKKNTALALERILDEYRSDREGGFSSSLPQQTLEELEAEIAGCETVVGIQADEPAKSFVTRLKDIGTILSQKVSNIDTDLAKAHKKSERLRDLARERGDNLEAANGELQEKFEELERLKAENRQITNIANTRFETIKALREEIAREREDHPEETNGELEEKLQEIERLKAENEKIADIASARFEAINQKSARNDALREEITRITAQDEDHAAKLVEMTHNHEEAVEEVERLKLVSEEQLNKVAILRVQKRKLGDSILLWKFGCAGVAILALAIFGATVLC